METSELLTLLLGGGLVATLTAFFQGIKSLQGGARAREKETVSELVDQRKEAWRDRDAAIDSRDYWRNRAGTVEFYARSAGVSLPELGSEPKPPEEGAER